MAILWGPLRLLIALNNVLLRAGRNIAWMCLAAMVLAILGQVFFRYVLGNALSWSEELARFLMLWMTGLIAPSGYRWGGFVAIDMVPRALPRVPGIVLNLVILLLALMVLVTGMILGYGEITGFGGRFASPSLAVPFNITFWPFEITFEWTKMAKKYMFASLWICCILMTLVNIELILRNLVSLLDPDREIPEDPHMIAAGAD